MSGEVRHLRLLLVEDSDDDEALLLRHLTRAGYVIEHERVFTADALRKALEKPWDIIISDFSMGGFAAPDALAVVRDVGVDTPFIVVSGTVSEDAAITALKGGAHDYLTKSNLARLVGAIERELREAAARKERRDMREQLVVSDRLASIGMLAAGIAHEINNPLAAIAGHLELVALDLKTDESAAPEIRASVADALEATRHLEQIVKDLAIFARGSAPSAAHAPVQVDRALDVAIRMATSQIRSRAQLVRQVTPTPLILGDESRLAQVFLNLLVNASHALDDRKFASNRIVATTRTDEVRRLVVVEISDTGSGIAPDVLSRIFDPLFTTKRVGAGSGLGLTITRNIVTSLGGTIDVESTLGEGSTFRVAFPEWTAGTRSGAS